MTNRPAPRRLLGGLLFVALAAGLTLAPAPNGGDEAQARPQHLKFFAKLYEEALGKDAIKKGRCDICHEKTQPKEKSIRNPYGAELAKLVKEKETDEKVFLEALKKVEAKQSCVEKKTYGDVIKKDKKLPSDGCKPVEPKDDEGYVDLGEPLLPVPDPNMN